MDDYVREFVDETEEAITRLNNLLLDLERSPDDEEVLQEIFRTAHTLKGNAGAMGLDRASDLSHAMEDLLDAIRAGDVEVTPDRMDTLFAAVDCLETMVDELAVAGAIETDPAETITALRAPLSDDSVNVDPPSDDELAAILTRFSPPSNPDHDAYLVRMAIADSAELNNGLVVIEALIDAFDLIGTDPSRTAIENEEYGKRIDAIFGTAVGEAAISAALEPVDAVEAFSILTVTDRIEDAAEDEADFSPIDDDLTADISSDEANDMSVDDLLDEFTELDDIDALAEEVTDVSEFEDIGEAGSFDDILSESSAEEPADDDSTAAADDSADTADESESVEDAGAVFEELKREVDMVGFDELQDELDELEFEEFDEEEVGMDELLGDDVDVDDPAFLDIEDSGVVSDQAATEAASPEEPAESAATDSSTRGADAASEPAVEDDSAGPEDDPDDAFDTPARPADGTDAPSQAAGEPEPSDGTAEGTDSSTEPDETSASAPSADQEPSSGTEAGAASGSSAFADELFSGGDAAAAGTNDPADTESIDAETDDSVADSDESEPVAEAEGTDPDAVDEAPSGEEDDSIAPTVDDETPAVEEREDETDSIEDAAEASVGDGDDVEEIEAGDGAETADPETGADAVSPGRGDEPAESAAADDDDPLDVTTDQDADETADADVGAVEASDAEPAAETSPGVDSVEADPTVDGADAADADAAVADESGTADSETPEGAASEMAVAFDLDEATDAPDAGSASEPDQGTEPSATDSSDGTDDATDDADGASDPEPAAESSGPEPTAVDAVSTDEAGSEPAAGVGDEVESDLGVDEAADEAPAADADGSETDDRSAGDADVSTTDDPDEVSAFGGEADAFDISSGLDDLGSSFEEDAAAADSFARDEGSADPERDSWASDEAGAESESTDAGDSSWDDPDESVKLDEVADFDGGLAFEDEVATGSDAAFETDDGGDFGSATEAAADGVAAEPAFETEAAAIDTSGTDFDDSADEESSATDDVIAELPEMEIPDIDIPTTAELDTDTDLEEHAQSVRVDREQIDSLLQLVEGLVTSRVRLRTAVDAREPYESIERELEELEDFTTELQETVMDVRLVPLQTVTNRLPRVVRDLAREQDKQVTFDQSDADVELDRRILDRIGDPLIHLVRNAVDHGIEDAETREEAGKAPEGTIELSAERTQNRVRIEISDDGSGLDPDRLREAAVEADILDRSDAEELSDDEAYHLVFHSGLSTADQVTDVSGRGVGMDVVRRTIDELNGTVSIDSAPDEGTTVSMTLPVSVAVDDVLFVESGGEQFGIPVDVVREIADGAYVTETDEELVFDTEDETLPVIEIGDELDTGESRIQDPDGMVVRIRDDVRDVALKCDVVHARREVVVNPFEGFMRNIPGVSGATVRGRGEVITILDVSTI